MTKSTVALAVALLASAGASAYLWQALEAERERTSALQARLTQLELVQASASNVAPLADARAVAEQEPSPASTEPAVSPAPPPATSPNALVGASGMVRSARMDPEIRRQLMASHEQQLRMLQDPEYRELLRSQHKLGMQQAYADLSLFVDLTPEQSERLFDMLAEQSLRNMERRPMLPPLDGSAPDDRQMRELQQEFETQRRNNEAEIAALLGPKYADWQAYQKNSWARAQVTRLRQSLSMTNEPLRQDQLKPLMDVMAREQEQMAQQARNYGAFASMAPGRTPDPQAMERAAEDWLEQTRQSHQRIRDAASGYLTPAQFQQLQRQQEQELKMHELSIRQSRARMEAQGRSELSAVPGFLVPGMMPAD